mmetsp:Transcript_6104/g.5398  ORF Transcript_6104/g.5398 Transcript_6104/m.5398 type:complete len:120 (+) Transcript_6104:624-983(+)
MVSLGKSQNREQASRKISEAQKKGEMVVLFNGHLDVEYLGELHLTLGNINNLNASFRLMVVCEISETLPHAMLRNNHKVIFERSNGIRESLERAWKSTLAAEVVDAAGFPNMKLLFAFS